MIIKKGNFQPDIFMGFMALCYFELYNVTWQIFKCQMLQSLKSRFVLYFWRSDFMWTVKGRRGFFSSSNFSSGYAHLSLSIGLLPYGFHSYFVCIELCIHYKDDLLHTFTDDQAEMIIKNGIFQLQWNFYSLCYFYWNFYHVDFYVSNILVFIIYMADLLQNFWLTGILKMIVRKGISTKSTPEVCPCLDIAAFLQY